MIKLKPEAEKNIIGHNNISKKAGDHTEDELLLLAIQARASNSKLLLSWFEELPELQELQQIKAGKELAPILPVASTNSKKNS